MKTIRFFLACIFCLFFLIGSVLAQKYVRLEDASGYTPTPEQIAELELAADSLCAAFDSAGFQEQFKVYDFGFYLHQEVTEGGYPEPFAQKIEEVAALSPYYLLFGKQTDRSGVYTRFWVEVKLPDSLCFTCLDTASLNSLKASMDLGTNTVHISNEYSTNKFHLAEIATMNKLRDAVAELDECCYYQSGSSSCSPECYLSEEEIKLYLERNGFFAIPIKVLGPIQSKPIGHDKGVTSRVEDCAEVSIEMDAVVIPNLANIIDDILSCYADSTITGFILDEDCICEGGGIEYLKNYISQGNNVGIKIIILKIFDLLFINMDTEYQSANVILPFKGHLPVSIQNQPVEINLLYIDNTTNYIFFKNGYSLSSLDHDTPSQLDFYDLFNEFTGEIRPSAGNSSLCSLYISCMSNYISYRNTVLAFADKINTEEHRNYIVGAHVAHEFTHQIVGKCVHLIRKATKNYSLLEDYCGGHCREQRNLMFPGDGLKMPCGQPIFNLTDEESKAYAKWNKDWPTLYVSKAFYPDKNDIAISSWELISPTFKLIISTAMQINEITKKFGENSVQYWFNGQIVNMKMLNKKFNSYD